ncbi:hypothetical protein EPN28_04780 [Patescibacteria group bacterium]|nr:MAG: hypothetical protein EPN28_04780 [Patescibacteria group bacterium]
MKTATQSQILNYIRSKKGAGAREIIKQTGKYPTGIFRHLKNLLAANKIYKIGNMPRARYYAFVENTNMTSENLAKAINWAATGDSNLVTPDILCQTRDVFQARADHLAKDLKRIIKDDDLIYLLIAAADEIGNNSFDHNIGRWQDVPGVFFQMKEGEREMIFADRGQGVLATISGVRPDIKGSADALRVAFTEIISGRAPEKRGNGLKLVKKIIVENNLYLEFYSGNAKAVIETPDLRIEKSEINITGTVVYLKF